MVYSEKTLLNNLGCLRLATQDALKLKTLLPQPLEYWDRKHVLPGLAHACWVLLCSPGWLGTCYVDKAGLEFPADDLPLNPQCQD